MSKAEERRRGKLEPWLQKQLAEMGRDKLKHT